jgi:hypothetical protein
MIRLNRSEYGSLASEPYLGSVVISIVARFDRPIGFEQIKQALRDVTLAIPRMRANVVPTWWSYKFAVLPQDEWLEESINAAVTPLPHVDAGDPAALEALQTQAINTPLLLTRGLPWYAWYIPHPERPVLIHNIHHGVGDGTSIGLIHRALFARLNGLPIETLPLESSSQMPGVAPAHWWQWPKSMWAAIRNAREDARQRKGEHVISLATRRSERYIGSGLRRVVLPGGMKAAKATSKRLGTTVNTLVSAVVAQVLLARQKDDPRAVAVLRIAVDLRRYFPKGQAPQIGNYVVNIELRARHQSDLAAQVKSLTEQVRTQLDRYDRREGALACVTLEALTYVITQGTLAKAFMKLKASGALNKTSVFITNIGNTASVLPAAAQFSLVDYHMVTISPSFFVAVMSHDDCLQLTISHQLDEVPKAALDEFLIQLDAQYHQFVNDVTNTPPA